MKTKFIMKSAIIASMEKIAGYTPGMNKIQMKVFFISFLLLFNAALVCVAQCSLQAPTPIENSVCGPGEHTFNAYTMIASTNLKHRWWTAPTGGTLISEALITHQNTGGYPLVSTYKTNISVTTTFYVSTFNTATGCESARSAITIVVKDPPAVSVSGVSLCGPGPAVLRAFAPAGSTIKWYNASGTHVGTGNQYATAYIAANTYYDVSFTVPDACQITKRANVIITNDSYALYIYPPRVCPDQSGRLEVTGGGSGAYYFWYDASHNLLQSTSSKTYDTEALSANTRFYVSYMNTAPPYCTTPLVPVDVPVGLPDAPTANAVIACSGQQVVLRAGAGLPPGATYRWYDSQGALKQDNTSNEFRPPLLYETTTYYVAIFKNCESTRTPVQVAINTTPAPTTTDGTSCGPGAVSLNAYNQEGDLSNLAHKWWTAEVGGSRIPDDQLTGNPSGYPLTTTYRPNLTETTTYWVSTYHKINHCESIRVPVKATVQHPPVSASSVSLCGPGRTILSATAPAGSTVSWRNAAGTQVSTNFRHKTDFIAANTHYNVTVTAPGYCTLTKRVDITITNDSYSLNVYPQRICPGQSGTLEVSGGASGAYYYWYDANNNLLQFTSSKTYITGALSANTPFYVSYMNTAPPHCTTPLVTVNVPVGAPDPPTVTHGVGCMDTRVTLKAHGLPPGATYRWYGSDGTLKQDDPATDFLTPSLDATTTYNAVIFKGCESSVTPVTATIHTVPSPTTSDATTCGPGLVSLTARTTADNLANLEHKWWTAETGGSQIPTDQITILPSGSPLMTTYKPTVNVTTTYYVSTYNSSNLCSSKRIPAKASVENPPVSVSNLSLCGPGHALLSATAPIGTTFRWVDPSSTQVSTHQKFITTFLGASTYYDVTMTAPGYCTITKRLAITVNDYPYNLTVEPARVCDGEAATLKTNGGIQGSYYYWYDANYNLLQSTSSNTLITPAGVTSDSRFYVNFMNTMTNYCVSPTITIDASDIEILPRPAIPSPSTLTYCDWEQHQLRLDNEFTGSYNWYNSTGTFLGSGTSLDIQPIYQEGLYNFQVETVSRYGCISPGRGSLTLHITSDCVERLNWIETKGFDNIGLVSNSRQYFDQAGNLLQSQTRSFFSDKIFLSQGIKDRYGRSIGSTMSAPSTLANFKYQLKFAWSPENRPYDYRDIDDPDNPSTILNPLPVANGVIGTLGWYYSSNNTWEDYVPITSYPYSRREFYEDGTGDIRRSASPGNQHRLGAGHEVLSGTFPVFSELNDYLAKRATAIPGVTADGSLTNEGVQSVVRDENGKYAISISDKSGKTVMSARALSDGEPTTDALHVSNTVTADNSRPIVYFYILRQQDVNINASGTYILEDLISGQAIAEPLSRWPVGFYRVIATAGTISVSYENYYSDVSYQFYNDAGRLVSSLSPNGYKAWKEGTMYGQIDKTTYQYNHQGWLLKLTEPDAGETNYVYRKDGKIRFSQNVEQAAKNKFSYTHYDKLGRPVESGEYTGTAVEFVAMTDPDFGGSAMKGKLEETFNQALWTNTAKKDWLRTHYDVPVTLDPALPGSFQQEFVRGAVSYTENVNNKTWYSYDEMGQVIWVAQKPSGLPRVFVTKYNYDFLGKVRTIENISYAGGAPVNTFFHHYEYDADQRLTKVYTSPDGSTTKLRATYIYYLHGPLKRIELGDDIQGIDFVYNINGWLTQINHPDKLQDPGRDTDDVFGMLLDYYESSMTNFLGASAINGMHDPGKIHNLPAQVASISSEMTKNNRQALQESFGQIKSAVHNKLKDQ